MLLHHSPIICVYKNIYTNVCIYINPYTYLYLCIIQTPMSTYRNKKKKQYM